MEFSARPFTPVGVAAMGLLVRVATCIMPVSILASATLLDALPLAIFMSLAAGCARPWLARSTSGFRAEQEGLVVRHGLLTTELVPWPDVLAIESWQFPFGADYVVVHYRSKKGRTVAACWEKYRHKQLVGFVATSARQARRAANGAPSAQLVSLRDRPIQKALARELVIDLALIIGGGAFIGRIGEAALLAALVGTLSGLMASTQFGFSATRFVLRDGLWQRVAADGKLVVPRPLPKKLKLWLTQLASASD